MIQALRRRRILRPAPKVVLPHALRRSRIYILPTRHGFLFLLVLAGMLLGSVNYNNNLGFLLTFLLGSMAFVSILHTHKNLLGIEIRSATPQPVFAGERAICGLRVGAGDHPRPAVDFAFAGEPAEHRALSVRRDNRIEMGMATSRRGVLRSGPMVIATRYPLGLFRAWSRFDAGVEWTVYPAPIAGPDAFREADSGPSAHASGESAVRGVEDFHGLKHYQPGDLPQHIAWKSYSKGQGLLTKVFSGLAGSTVILDWDLVREEDVEQKLSRLSGLVLRVSGSDLKYGLTIPGKTIEPDKGDVHKHECLKALALFGNPRGKS